MTGQLPQQGTPQDKSFHTGPWHTLTYAFVKVFSFWITWVLIEKKNTITKTHNQTKPSTNNIFMKSLRLFQPAVYQDERQLISLPPGDQKILVTVSTENSARFLIIFAVLKCKYTDYMFTKNICIQIMASTAQSQLLPVPMYCLKCSQDWKKLWYCLIISQFVAYLFSGQKCLILVVILQARGCTNSKKEPYMQHYFLSGNFLSGRDSCWSVHLGHSALWPSGEVHQAPL